jgi:hypothetical protein
MSAKVPSGAERGAPPLDIVVLGGFPWDETTNHPALQTVRALVAEHRVLYVCDSPQGSALRHLLAPKDGRSSTWSAPRRTALSNVFTRMGTQRIAERLWVAPLHGWIKLLPLSYPEPVRKRAAARLASFIRRETAAIGMQSPVLWFYWWFFPELTRLPHALSLYDNIDDHTAYDHNRRWSSVRLATHALERRLLQTVDLAYALSPDFATRMQSVQPRMRLQIPGIDATAVGAALAEPHRPQDLASLPRPLIGYAGQIGDRIDWRTVSMLAASRPEWTFAFVGGDQPSGLTSSPNLHFLPGRPYPEIMRAIREFDVGLVPWVDSPATRGAYSYKTLDYLAAGKQVIATHLPFSADLARRHSRVVSTVSSTEEWGLAIERSLDRVALSSTAQECVVAAHSRTTVTRTEAIVADIRASLADRTRPDRSRS